MDEQPEDGALFGLGLLEPASGTVVPREAGPPRNQRRNDMRQSNREEYENES
jgi:hypothetical protein